MGRPMGASLDRETTGSQLPFVSPLNWRIVELASSAQAADACGWAE